MIGPSIFRPSTATRLAGSDFEGANGDNPRLASCDAGVQLTLAFACPGAKVKDTFVQ